VKGLDTNVLLRLLLQDDPQQGAAAKSFAERECRVESPCWINRVVLCELIWVLDAGYGYSRPLIVDVVDRILRTPGFSVEDVVEARVALELYRSGKADLADAFIAATNVSSGCEITITFDKVAARSKGFRLLGEPSG
jgi:predicted nucleic-acid-binding protein